MELDILDRKILYHLDLDSRQSAKEIAKRIGSNKDTVNYRMKRLEQEGVIEAYRARVHVSRMGLISIKTYIKFQDTDEQKEKEFYDFLKSLPEVGWVVQTSGRWDALFLVWTRSAFSYYKIMMKVLDRFSRNIYDKEIVHNIQEVYYNHKWLLPDSFEPMGMVYGGEQEEQRLDSTDIALLSALVGDGRAKMTSVAGKVGISPQNALQRVKRLREKGIITQYNIDLGYRKLGIVYAKAAIRLHNLNEKALEGIKGFCEREPRIFAFMTTLGAWDLELEMEVEKIEDMMDIMNRIKRAFPDFIKDYDSMIIAKQLKTKYIPVEGKKSERRK
jgi:Lrp/AsnC family leucine-responsive transcriptional regulator